MCAKRSAYEDKPSLQITKCPQQKPSVRLHECANLNREVLRQMKRIYTPKILLEERAKRALTKARKYDCCVSDSYSESACNGRTGRDDLGSRRTEYALLESKGRATEVLNAEQLAELECRQHKENVSRDIMYIEEMIDNLRLLAVAYPDAGVDGVLGGLETLRRSKTRRLKQAYEERTCTEDAVDALHEAASRLSENVTAVYKTDIQEEKIRKYRFTYRDKIIAATLTKKAGKRSSSLPNQTTLASVVLRARERRKSQNPTEIFTSLPPCNHTTSPDALPPNDVIVSEPPIRHEFKDPESELDVKAHFQKQNHNLNEPDHVLRERDIALTNSSELASVNLKKGARMVTTAREPLKRPEVAGMSPYVYSYYVTQKYITTDMQRRSKGRHYSLHKPAGLVSKGAGGTATHGLRRVEGDGKVGNKLPDVETPDILPSSSHSSKANSLLSKTLLNRGDRTSNGVKRRVDLKKSTVSCESLTHARKVTPSHTALPKGTVLKTEHYNITKVSEVNCPKERACGTQPYNNLGLMPSVLRTQDSSDSGLDSILSSSTIPNSPDGKPKKIVRIKSAAQVISLDGEDLH